MRLLVFVHLTAMHPVVFSFQAGFLNLNTDLFMKFKPGDKVNILNQDYGGEIIKFISPNMYEIYADHGFSEIHEEDNLVISGNLEDYRFQTFVPENHKKDQEIARRKQSGEIENQILIDLHTWEFIETTSGLSNHEILLKQVSQFRNAMNLAMSNNTKEIIIIHGVGKGVLRREIRIQLDEYYPDAKYFDAPVKDYGINGATKVCFY